MTPTPNRVTATAAQAPAGPAPVSASIDASLVRERFNWDWCIHQDTFTEADTYWWYASSIRLDPNEVLATDDEGNLWSVPFTTDGLTEVTFGTPVRGGLMFVPAAASDGVAASTVLGRRRQRVLASGLDRPNKPDPTDTTPARATAELNHQEEPNTMSPEARAFLVGRGIDPDTASSEVINIAESASALPNAEQLESTPAETPAEETPVETPAVPELVAAAAATLPAAGTVIVDEARLAALEAAEADRAAEDRERTITAALEEGRFAPARRAHYETAWAADPAGTRHLLTASAADGGLAPNTVPVKERGGQTPQAADTGSLGRALAASGLHPNKKEA